MSTAPDVPALTVDSTNAYRRHVQEAAAFVTDRLANPPVLGLVIDTGRETLPEDVTVNHEWALDTIPHMPHSDAASGTLLAGTTAGRTVLALDGPLALHDGFTARQVAFPVRMMAEAGVNTLLFATTAGSVHPEVAPSDLFLVTDHINFQGVNPLVGPNVEAWGPRFPDMSEPYDPDLRATAQQVALQAGIGLQKGIFFAALGPNLGTQAESRMVRTLGADAVGTGTVPEVIAARHMDVRVLTLALITDRCAPDTSASTTASALAETVDAARPRLRRLLSGIVTAHEEKGVPA
jgi:purine-nucleoside phosphorylase